MEEHSWGCDGREQPREGWEGDGKVQAQLLHSQSHVQHLRRGNRHRCGSDGSGTGQGGCATSTAGRIPEHCERQSLGYLLHERRNTAPLQSNPVTSASGTVQEFRLTSASVQHLPKALQYWNTATTELNWSFCHQVLFTLISGLRECVSSCVGGTGRYRMWANGGGSRALALLSCRVHPWCCPEGG